MGIGTLFNTLGIIIGGILGTSLGTFIGKKLFIRKRNILSLKEQENLIKERLEIINKQILELNLTKNNLENRQIEGKKQGRSIEEIISSIKKIEETLSSLEEYAKNLSNILNSIKLTRLQNGLIPFLSFETNEKYHQRSLQEYINKIKSAKENFPKEFHNKLNELINKGEELLDQYILKVGSNGISNLKPIKDNYIYPLTSSILEDNSLKELDIKENWDKLNDEFNRLSIEIKVSKELNQT